MRPSQVVRPLVITIAAVAGASVVSVFVSRQFQLQNRVLAGQWLNPVAAVLTSEMSRSFRVSSFLAVAVVMDPGLAVNAKAFRQVAQPLLDNDPGVLALQLAPGGVLQQQIPLSKNAPIGLNLLRTPDNRPKAELAIRTRASVMQGPFPLVQGGNGIVIRTPVFVGDPDQFWGFSSALIDWDRLLSAARSALPGNQGMRLVVREASPTGRVIWGPGALKSLASVMVPFPQGRWFLEAVAEDLLTSGQKILIVVGSLVSGVLSGALAWFVMRQISQRILAQANARAIPFITFTAMTEIARSRDEETGQHLARCRLYSLEMAKALRQSGHPEAINLTDDDIDALAAAVPLHDIGKVGIPDAVLQKPGRLDPSEWEVMKRHTKIGAEIIERLSVSLPVQDRSVMMMARCVAIAHHENWDGSGYPYGLNGRDIPLIARIMSVIDVYDAMASRRVYKDPIPHAKVLEEMRLLRGGKFDPDLLDQMMLIEAKFRCIYERNQDPS